ncbi:MAG: hypothetical protein FWG58_03270 [Methanomassiliicoccaceae archaeon]|nr:hypothetical protein [Methanomassiliicoccaceae archaeon]
MYTEQTGLILGFHGCSERLAKRVISGKDEFKPSEKPYDWLGKGTYFWERDPRRAYEFAVQKKSTKPSVVGAFIDPGRCLDLRCREGQEVVRSAYKNYYQKYGVPEQKNTSFTDGIPLKRELDCLMIEAACKMDRDPDKGTFDTVIGTFIEGKEIFPGAGICDKTHTQICVRNPDCILGYFNPRGEIDFYPPSLFRLRSEEYVLSF